MLPSVCALLLLTLVLFVSVLIAWRRLGPRAGSLLVPQHTSGHSPPSAAALAHRFSGLCAALDDRQREAFQHCETTLAREQQLLAQAGCFLPTHAVLAANAVTVGGQSSGLSGGGTPFNNYSVSSFLDRQPSSMHCKEQLDHYRMEQSLNSTGHHLNECQLQPAAAHPHTNAADGCNLTSDHLLPSPYAANTLDYALPKPPTAEQLCSQSASAGHQLHGWSGCGSQLKPPPEFSNQHDHPLPAGSSVSNRTASGTGDSHTYDVPIPPKWV